MLRSTQFPPVLLVRAARLRLSGRVHFPRDRVGDVVRRPGEDYEIFRKMTVDGDGPPGAAFEVGFRFARFPDRVNRWLSRIPMPLIAAQPGFRSKTWMSGRESGAFLGVYEWDTVEDAERYWDSLPMRLMRRRAAPGTLEKRSRPCRRRA